MIVYICCFAISVLFTYLASKNTDRRILFCLYSTIALLFPALIAGCRDTTVGTDTEFYGLPSYNMVVQMGEFGIIMGVTEWEPIYTILIYLGELIHGTFNAGLFLIAFWCVFFAYVAIYLMRDKLSMTFAMFVYLIMFYNPSLNIMRQCMAMSVCMVCWVLFYKQKYLLSFFTFFIAFFCHYSSILFFLPILLYWIYNNERFVTNRTLYIMCLLTPFFMLMYSVLLSIAIKIGILSTHFEAYVDSDETSFSKTNVLTYLVFLYIVYICGRRSSVIYKDYYYLLMIAYISFVLMFSSIFNQWAYRAGFFFSLLFPLHIPMMFRELEQDRGRLKLFYILFLSIFWFWDVVINGSNSTYPYTSEILGIE